MSMEKTHMTIAEFADRKSVSVPTMRRYIKKGIVTVHHVGTRVTIPVARADKEYGSFLLSQDAEYRHMEAEFMALNSHLFEPDPVDPELLRELDELDL